MKSFKNLCNETQEKMKEMKPGWGKRKEEKGKKGYEAKECLDLIVMICRGSK